MPSTTAESTEADLPAAGVDDANASRRRLRLEHAVLAAFIVVGLFRGLFWVALTEVWNPVDETAHFAYVESLATGKGIPEVGRDLVSNDVLGIAKESPTYFSFRSQPYQPDAADGNWGGTRHQYEAVQGPVYYALMVPFYWIGRPFGFLSAVYAVRIGSLLLSLAAVPLTWLLGRELFPRRRWVGLTAAGLLVIVNGFNGNVTSASNDSLAIVASAGAILLFVRAMRGRRPAQVLAAGLCLGVAVVNKTTALELVPLLGIALLVTVLRAHWRPRALATWAAIFVAGIIAAIGPWLAFNFATYGAASAAAQVDPITGGTLVHNTLSIAGLHVQLDGSRLAFSELARADPTVSDYRTIFEVAVVLAAIGGVAIALARRRPGEAAWLAWLALALPLAFAVMMGIVYGVFGGAGVAIGRHYYPVLVPTVLLIGAGATELFGRRGGALAVVALTAVLATAERGVFTRYTDAIYASQRVGNAVPLVEQSWNDGFVPAESVEVDAPCATARIAMVLEGSPPGTAPPVTVTGSEGSSAASAEPVTPSTDGFTSYTLATPVAGRLAVTFARPTSVGASLVEREAAVSIPGRTEDPEVRVYCPVADPVGKRFAQRYGPLHPAFLTPGRIRLWADGWMVALWSATVVVAVGLLTRRRRGAPSTPPAEGPR